MVFANRVSSADLMTGCRYLRVGLEAGLPIVDVFRKQATRGPWRLRTLMGRVAERLADGDTLADALSPERNRLPNLFVALVGVGEQTGHLAETFRELEEHYELQTTLARNFRVQMIWPAINYFGAVGVICLMLLVMGCLGIKSDPLGVGTGPVGALRVLLIAGSLVAGLYLLYLGVANRLRFLAPVERIILRLPALGPALEAVLLSRFCLGLRLTLGAGLPVPKALKHSLDAAASSLYAQAYEKAKPGLKRGEELSEVLQRCRVFPRDFLDIVANAEEGGQVPEVMARVARNYQDDAARKLKVLATVAAWAVYAAVAVMIIILIFRLYAATYAPVFKMIDGL
jgi:type II secretory pathway component PulF